MKKQIYLIIDAEIPLEELQQQLNSVLPFISKVQLYHTKKIDTDSLKNLIYWLTSNCKSCWVYEDKEALKWHPHLGIHLDEVEDISELEKTLQRVIPKGVTVGNDLEKLKKAEALGYDYISFCSVFPTTSAAVCELVNFEKISQARSLFSREIFLAGGINESTQPQLEGLDYDGIAVISALMDAKNPLETLQKLQ